MGKKYRKPNWKKVEIKPRDERLIRTVGDEGFIRRDFVIKYIFEGSEIYAKNRIRKLKRFGYLEPILITKPRHCERPKGVKQSGFLFRDCRVAKKRSSQ